MQPILLDRYRPVIRSLGEHAVQTPAMEIARQDPHALYYVPFEHVNPKARLVIVGITPGPNQLAASYGVAARMLREGADDASILAEAKREGSFGSSTMRPNLVRMLDALGFQEILGLPTCHALWEEAFDLLHATSVVPHAAFLNGKPFAGSFAEVLDTPILRRSFLQDFVPSLAAIPSSAHFVALGPTPLDALRWCAERGHIAPERILGALAHPSSQGGSQVNVYLGSVRPEDLHERDPVRGRIEWLTQASHSMRAAVSALRGSEGLPAPMPVPVPVRPAPAPVMVPAPRPEKVRSEASVDVDHVAPAHRQAFRAAGYVCVNDHRKKVALFTGSRTGREVYLLNEGLTIQVVVHPGLRERAQAAADVIGARVDFPYKHANLGTFKEAMGPDSASPQGAKIRLRTPGDLERFLGLFDHP